MAKKKKKTEDLEDFEVIEEVEEEEVEVSNDTEGMLSAKEAAKLIGTDQRSFRKFLRKKSGKVGQGNRWLINPDDIEELKAEFASSARPKSEDSDEESDDEEEVKPKKKKKAKPKKKATPPPDDDDDDDEDNFEVLDEIDEL